MTDGYPNPCPVCGARPFDRCRSLTKGKVTDTHQARVRREWPDEQPAEDGYCTCDGDPRVDVTCGISRHRLNARKQIYPVPPPNRLLAATVDDEPAEPLV